MAKKIVRLTETEFQNVISESVKRILKEGHWNQEVYNEWDDVRNTIGDDTMISELYNWLEASDIENFLSHIKRQYDLDYDTEDDYDNKEEDWDDLG